MKMPDINIAFYEKAVSAIERSERGIVAILLKDKLPVDFKNPITILSVTDIPIDLSDFNKNQIQLALKGYVNAPNRIICYIMDTQNSEENSEGNNLELQYNAALDYLYTIRADYLVVPTVEEDGQKETIVSWIKKSRQDGKKIKAVLPNIAADSEGIINYTTDQNIENDTIYTAAEFCSRIAGLIAGTPINIACTYAPLPEITDCTRLSKIDMDKAMDEGKFIIFYDGEKVKAGLGINSFVTTTSDKGQSFKKIKIVEAMDMIYDDIKKTLEDDYIGKYANSYDNKCLLISAIQAYLDELKNEQILNKDEENIVDIDVEQQTIYLKSIGRDVTKMTAADIKKADTGDKVFLVAHIKILDALESVSLPIYI